ncbi:hypothetical protein B0H14DRAFT_2610621 [Mycena olivaceomarginata]|nr:hypothetical protein B0H14DRAFT_2610621 [Mycena olivaceomarginata]
MPKVAEIEANIDAYTAAEDTPTGPPRIAHQVLMLDEIAVEKRARWDDKTKMILGCGIRIAECSDTKATYILANSLQTPMQQHFIAQPMQALAADAECVCSGSSSAVPTVSSLTPAAPSVSLPGPLAKERERGSGSDMGLHDGTEDEERGSNLSY